MTVNNKLETIYLGLTYLLTYLFIFLSTDFTFRVIL